MDTLKSDELPAVFEAAETEIRAQDAGGMNVAFYRLPAGTDARPVLQGLPDNLCQCPHWGYVISGMLRIHTADGHHDVVAGQALYVEPGHAPEALEETTMVEFSPAREAHEMWEHLQRVLARAQAAAR